MTAKNNMSTPMNFKEGLEDLMKDAAMARPHHGRVTSLPPKAIGFATSVLLHSATLADHPTPGGFCGIKYRYPGSSTITIQTRGRSLIS